MHSLIFSDCRSAMRAAAKFSVIFGVILFAGIGFVPQQAAAQNSVIEVSSGLGHSCAITTTGVVKCWGNNVFGQLGDGTYTNSTTPIPVLNITDATNVEVGYEHACAVLSSGEVQCWGRKGATRLPRN
jgi:alpha-tubulin suppressor-like RCC1 family protein